MKPNLKPKSMMKINFDAKSWGHLVFVDEIEGKPPTTFCTTSELLKEPNEFKKKLCIIDMPTNSQSVERAVKLTFDNAKQVY